MDTLTRLVRTVALALIGASASLAVPRSAFTQQVPDPPSREHPASSDISVAKTLSVPVAGSKVEVDGVLDEAAWRGAPSLELPYEWEPGNNTPAPVRTTCFVTHDRSNLYLGCRAHDPEPDKIRAHMTDRDTPIDDDYVSFLFDTFNDQRRSYEFRINPYGIQMDAVVSQGSQEEDLTWDTIWSSAGRIDDEGYVIEAAIPFKSLTFQPTSEEQTWGFIAGRSYPRSVRHRLRSIYADPNDTCLLCQADKLEGFQGVRPGRDLELNPTLTTSRTDRRQDLSSDGLESGAIDVEPGLFLYWGITPNVGLTGTINPDFSQVEADVAQLEVNRRFTLFFPEKRPFFLEGADFFQLGAGGGIYLPLVFTRKVVDPIAGGKLIAKLGSNAIGAFVTQDEVNSLVFPGPESSADTLVEEEVTGATARYRRDIGTSSTLGLTYTGREGSGYYSRALSGDGAIRLSRSNTLSFVAVHSRTRYPEAIAARFDQPVDAFSGEAFYTRIQHNSRNLFAALEYRDLDPGFRGDAGFIPRVGLRGFHGGAFYTFWGSADRWFSSLVFGFVGTRLTDYEGELTDQELRFSAYYFGPLQSGAFVQTRFDKQRFGGELFDLTRSEARLLLQPSGDVSLLVYGQIGDEIDFENVREAHVIRLSPEVSLNIGSRIVVAASHEYERLSLEGERIFVANLLQGRVVYHFNPRAFVRAILQYRALDRNPELYDLAVEESVSRLFTQFLFSYEVNPRTVLFAGYSDNRLGLTELDMTTTDRSFFLKLAYAWRP